MTELTELFKSQRQRTGGDRATTMPETWAIILAQRELGESLQDIAEDLEMRYETVKTVAKLARKALEADHWNGLYSSSQLILKKINRKLFVIGQ